MTQLSRRRLGTFAVLAGVFVSSLDLFIVNIAFPSLQRSFTGISVAGLQWVLSAYAIVFAALLVPAGRWADREGRKRAFVAGLALFTLASALCAAAPSVGMLIAARVLQAIGGAVMLPSSLGLLLPMFPAEKRAGAVGLWAAVGGAAAAAGPPIGGLLVQLSWRWVFLVNLPVGLITLVVAWRVLAEVRTSEHARPDVAGAVLIALTVAAVVGGIVQGPAWGWLSARVIALLAGGVAGTVVSVQRARRHPAPVVEPAVMRIRQVALANLAGLIFFTGFGAMLFSSVLFLTGVWHESVLRAGLEIAPGPLMAAAFAVPGGLLGARFGQARVGIAGALLFFAGAMLRLRMTGTPDYGGAFLPAFAIGGVGVGLMLPSLSGAATLPLPPERFATGTALLSMSRQMGLALGIAVMVAVIGHGGDVGRFDAAWWIQGGCALLAGSAMAGILLPARGEVAAVPAAVSV